MSTSVSVNRVPLPANTDGNIPGTLVRRDASGNFSAGTVAANITGNLTGNVTGNALTATALQNSRTIELTGDVTGSASFNGTTNAAITANIGSGVIVNADISNSAAIAGTKISPNFGSQNITTTGVVRVNGAPVGTFGAIGTAPATPQLAFINNADANNAPFIVIAKSRADGLINGVDTLGNIVFQSHNGTAYQSVAVIAVAAEGSASATSLPTRLSFATTPADAIASTERMRITSAGNVGIGTSNPSSKLHVAGDLTLSSATTATTATAGANGDVPAQVEGYLAVSINGTPCKIPYYLA